MHSTNTYGDLLGMGQPPGSCRSGQEGYSISVWLPQTKECLMLNVVGSQVVIHSHGLLNRENDCIFYK